MTRFYAHFVNALSLGLPLAGSHLAQISINLTDTVMLGWFGVEALAALSLAGPYYFVMFLMGQGFALAVMPRVAAAISAGDHNQVRRDTRMGLWLTAGFGFLCVPLMWFSAPILIWLRQDPELAALCQEYLRIAGWSLPLFLMATTFKSFLSSLEHGRAILWITLTGTALNVVLNWALIFGNFGLPRLGLTGAAIASLGTHGLILVVMALYAVWHRNLRDYAILTRIWRPDPEALRQVFQLGYPIGLTSFAESALFTAAGLMTGWLGQVPLAAHGVALQIAGITFMVHVGFSSAATVRIGQAHGRKDREDIRLAALATGSLSLGMVAFTVLLFLSVPEFLVGLFLDPDDPARPEVIALGRSLLAVAALFQLVDAAQVMALGFLRGVQDTRVPMIYATVSYWIIGIPASYILGFLLDLGAVGIWLGMVIGLSAASLSLMARFWGGSLKRV